MATYKEKVGTSVVNYAGDYPGAVEGELWYDSTNKNFNYHLDDGWIPNTTKYKKVHNFVTKMCKP